MVQQLIQSVLTAVVIAVIFGVFKVFKDVEHLKTTTEPLLEWWRKTSMDALKIATNPTSKRLTELADKYIACITGECKESMPISEKEELITGLREVLHNKGISEAKRQSASMSLRFIQSQEKFH